MTGAECIFQMLSPGGDGFKDALAAFLSDPPPEDCLSPVEKQRVAQLVSSFLQMDGVWDGLPVCLFYTSLVQKYCDGYLGTEMQLRALEKCHNISQKLQLFYNIHVFCFCHNLSLSEALWQAYFDLCNTLRNSRVLPQIRFTPKKKRGILLTSQLLGPMHQPSRNMAIWIKILEQEFGYDMVVLNTYENPPQCNLPLIDGNYSQCMPSRHGFQMDELTGMRVFTPESTMPSPQGYNEVYAFVQAWQPEFILNFGSYNFSGEYLGRFCNVISMEAGTGIPPTHTSGHIVTFRPLTEEDLRLLNRFGMADIPRIRSSYCYGMPEISQKYRREDFGLSADDVVLAVVGNRLALEMTDENLNLFANILKQNPRLKLLFVGFVADQAKAYIGRYLPSARISFTGYVTDVPSLFDNVCDGYLNPGRIGGGGSAAYAIATGLPVFTLNVGHVAANTHPDFVFPTEGAMLSAIRNFAEHKGWAELQGKARSRFAEISDRRVMLRDILTGAGLLH